MKTKTIIVTLLICMPCLWLSGCLFRPYRTTIQQGKIITPTMLKQIKPGMSRDQIEYLLGTPDINNPFTPNTLFYVYTNQVGYLPRASSKLILHFKDNKLDTLSGDYPPPSRLAYKVYKTPEASQPARQ